MGRQTGLRIDSTNPDNVLIGDYLRYICPENPNLLGTSFVVQNDTNFYVKVIVIYLFAFCNLNLSSDFIGFM